MPYVPFDFEALYKQAKQAADATESHKEWKEFGYDSFETWKDDFKKGQTDLFWLCTQLLGMALVESTHRPITDDFFIKKNPYVEANNWKQAVAKQSTRKNRLLLYPRGSFKSTIDRADAIQWMLCFPNIRVIYMTAEDTLATEFVASSRKPFEVKYEPDEDKRKKGTPKTEKLTRFQMLYFAHCIPAKKKEDESQFTSNAKKEDTDQPSIRALSLGASTVGKHADVGKFDDCVSNKNSGPTSAPEMRKKVTEEIKLARNIIDQYGYRDYVGTNYNEDDAYVSLEDTIVDLLVLRKSAWEVKHGAKSKPIHELTENDVELLFPVDSEGVPRLTFNAIMTEYKSDPFICSCQLLLDPRASKTAKFTEPMLRRLIIPYQQFPQPGTYFTVNTWDFAKTDGESSDRSVGISGFMVTHGPLAGKAFVTEIRRDRFSRSDLALNVAGLAAKWRPIQHIGVEKSPGADFLTNDIVRALARAGYSDAPQIDWIPVNNQKGAKNARALTLESVYIESRLFFSDQIPKELMDEVIKEHVRFKGDSNRKNDAVDALAYFITYLPKDIKIPVTEQEKMSAAWEVLRRKTEHEKMFYTRENPTAGEDKDTTLWKRDGYDRKPDLPEPPPTHWEGLPIFQSLDQQLYGT